MKKYLGIGIEGKIVVEWRCLFLVIKHNMISKDDIKSINSDILKLFYKQPTKAKKDWLLYPGVYHEDMFSNGAKVLFLGLNPAWKAEDDIKGFRWPMATKIDEKFTPDADVIKVHREAVLKTKKGYPYFYYKEFYKMFSEDESTLYDSKPYWNSIDLLQYRSTSQTELYDFFDWKGNNISSIKKEYNEFIQGQIDISKELIDMLNPEIIVVCSAFARDIIFFMLHLEYDSSFDPTLGCWNIEWRKYIFTSMLSGQRALDNGSKKIIQWHIQNLLSNVAK